MSMVPSFSLLVRGGALLMGGAVIQALAGFASQLVLMRLLVPEAFGEFALVLAGCGFVQMLLSLRLNVTIIRLGETELTPERRHQYYSAICLETALTFPVIMGSLYVLDLLSPVALILAASLSIGHWLNQVTAFYERQMNYRSLTVVETTTQLCGHAAAVIMGLAGLGATALYLREFFVICLRLVSLHRLDALVIERPSWLQWQDWRHILQESSDIWVDAVVDGGFQRVVVLISGSLGGLHGAGVFSQALRLAQVPHQILSPVVARMLPNMFARMDHPEKRRRWLVRLNLGMGAMLTVAAVAAVTLADPVVPWLFGEHWRPAVPILLSLAGVVVFYSLFEQLRGYCLSRRRTRIAVFGRVLQYAVIGCAALLASHADEPMHIMAVGLSAAYAFGFILTGALLARDKS